MTDFDPKAYLADVGGSGGGFDPKSYLREVANQSPEQSSLAGGMAKQFGYGAAEGTVGLPGIPGNLISAGKAAGDWINRNLNPFASPKNLAILEATRNSYAKTPPTSGEVVGAAENATGFHPPEPTNWEERLARTTGEFLPNAAMGPGSVVGRLATRVAVPAALSEGAGELTQGTAAEPYARALAPLLTEGPRAVRDIKNATSKPSIVGPTEQEQRQFSTQLYNRARNLGVEFKSKPIADLSDKIVSDLTNDGFRRLDAPSTWSKLEELKNPAGKNVTISDIESVRKALQRVPPTEWGAKRRAVDAIDNYLATIDRNPGHIAVNQHYAGSLSNIMKDARSEWAAMERGNTVENALKQAVFNSGVSGNLDTKLRQQIKQILSKAVLKKRGGFNADEIAAMDAIVGGSGAGNAASVAGSVAPHGAVRVAAAHAIGSMFPHHLAATTIISALGKVSKTFADRNTQRKVEQLIQQVRSRGPLGQTIPQPGRQPISVSPYVGTGLLGQSSAEEHGHAAGGRAEGGEADDVNLSPDAALASSMTHWGPDPAAEDVGRRVRQTGQNLYDRWLGPAERLGRGATSGTLDVTNPDTAGDALGLAGSVAAARMPFAKAGELGSAGGKPITAYHGSPHDFDKFDTSKIGTGEGAQAYGHGLYFAENEGVAEDYKKFFVGKSAANDLAEGYLNNFKGDSGRALEYAQSRLSLATKNGDKTAAKNLSEAIDALKSYKPPRMYQVAINADPEHFLDWDKPLSEQSEKVREALKGLGQSEGNKHLPRTGETALKSLTTNLRGDHAKVTEQLRAAGIPGIKYLDQGSRAGGEGTRNYVVFDDKLVDILKKYGLAGLVAGGAYHYQDKAQAQGRASGGRVKNRAVGGPTDDDEESDRAQVFFNRNSAWTKPGAANFNTRLGQLEPAFRQWVMDNKVPFDYKNMSRPQDYDMRGFWKALQAGDPIANSAIDPNDSRLHYPDYWKTPYHETFSNESQWAAPNAPSWNDKDQLVLPSGDVLFDDRAQQGRASGGAVHKQSSVGLATLPRGVAFRCGTCMFFKSGKCHNEHPELNGRKVNAHTECCSKFDRTDMKVIA